MGEFATTIQWLGTLAFAFVAIGYVKAFITAICKQLFTSDEFVDKTFEECLNVLPDQVSIDSLEPIIVEGRSSNDDIEDLKRRLEKIKGRIETSKKGYKQVFPEACQIKSLSSVSLYSLIMCTGWLLVACIEEEFSDFAYVLVCTSAILSIIYYVLGWILGEKEHKKLLRFTSIRHSLWCAVLVLAISIFASSVVSISEVEPLKTICVNDLWQWTLFVCLFCGFCNFIVQAWRIGMKAKDFKKKIEINKENILSECKDILKSAQELRTITSYGQNKKLMA